MLIYLKIACFVISRKSDLHGLLGGKGIDETITNIIFSNFDSIERYADRHYGFFLFKTKLFLFEIEKK